MIDQYVSAPEEGFPRWMEAQIRTYPIIFLRFPAGKRQLLSEVDGELRDDDKLPEFERCGDDFFAERGHVVLVRSSDLLDESVRSKAFQQA